MVQVLRNEEHKGIEIYFDDKPAAETITALKGNGFRWHRVKKCWYAKETAARNEFAHALTNGAPIESAPAEEKSNAFGVKVGDMFSMSWGYDQTNVDFFQVVELVGKSSVRVREVYPEIIESTACCSMSEDRVYKITNEILPPSHHSVWIKDNERGDIKRLKHWHNGEVVAITMGNHTATICRGETQKEYVSWYH